MKKKYVYLGVLCIIVLSILLAACDEDPVISTKEISDKNISLDVFCDHKKELGVFFATASHARTSDRGYGYGFAVRMTNDEYARYCGQE